MGLKSVYVRATEVLSPVTDNTTRNETGRSQLSTRLARLVSGISLTIAFCVYVVALALALQTVPRPFLGVFVEPTSVVSIAGADSWNGLAADLEFPDRLVRLDGHPLTRPPALYETLSGYASGEAVTLDVERPDGDSGRLNLRLESLPLSALFGFFVLPFGIGLGYLATGLAVYIVRRDRMVGRVFPVFCASFALASGTLFDLYTTHRLTQFWVLGMALIGGSLIHLGLVFPERFHLLHRRPWLSLVGYLPSVPIAIWGSATTVDMGAPWAYIPAWRTLYLYAGLGVLAWLAALVYRRFHTDSPAVRQQTRVVMLGVVAASLPLLAWFFLAAIQVDIGFQPVLLFAPLILLPLAIAFVILRHRLPDVDLLASRGVSYGLMILLVVGGYLLFVRLVEVLLGTRLEADHPVVVVLLVFVILVTFNPLRTRLFQSVARLTDSDRIDYREALETYSRDLGRMLTQSEIFTVLTERIELGVHPQRLMFFVYDEPAAQFAPLRDNLGSSRGVRFSPNGGLARLLMEQHQTVHLEAGEPVPRELEWDADQLVAVGASLYVPLPQHGWMALGDKRSGEPYTTEDVTYLEALSDQTALALDRVQLISDLERRVTELNALRWISQAVQFSVGLDDLLELIYNQTSRVLGIDNFYITLYDEPKGALSFAFYVEGDERYYPSDEWPLEMGGLQAEIIRSGQAIVTEDYMSECLRREIAPGGKADRAWMGVPLNAGDRVIGVMTVSSSEPGVRYTPDQLSIFSAIADQAASIIDRAWLDEKMQDRARQLATLNEVGRAINSTLDLDTVLQLVTEKAAEILEAESGSIWLTDRDTGELVFQIAVGPLADTLVGMRLHPGVGIVGATAEAQEILIVNDTQRDQRWFAGADEDSGFISRMILSVPFVNKGLTIGVLQVLNKLDGSPFDETDAQLMQAFAAQASAALENARLFTLTDQALAERVEELSTFQQIDYALNATLDYRNVIQITLNWAVQKTGARVGAVMTLDEEQGGLFLVASLGYPPEFEEYRERAWPVSDGIIGRAVRFGEPVIVDDVTKDPDHIQIVPEARAQMVVPLRVGKTVIGAISLASPNVKGFSEDDLQFANRLAERSVVPIRNAQLYEQVKRANEAKSQFVSMVAHELKVPMTSIMGYARLLEMTDGPIDETKKGFLKTINSNVDRMTKTVNDLLDISRIETGRLKLEMDAVSVLTIIDDTLASLRGAIENKGLALTIAVPDNLPLVWGDRTRLIQIMTNLISNATKYTPRGSIHISAGVVELPLSENGHDDPSSWRFVRCSVADTGIGISKEDQERLFKAQFVRFDNAVDVAAGHGLGLWLVNRLAELQGGRITFESELGAGSTFSLTVPVADEQAWSPDQVE
jgi:NtrC-family two-component system sensor histidine kinase KinB